ncbi:hypothetical protein L1049_012579 [Liquidambar formosana]|uniref:Uncharacterized protein n=1 Tax=Liquidambar formosana TaxID=63359 RepID=A0AAP0N1Z6_LIQFO
MEVGTSKKRKLCHDNEKDEDDEEKMEKFFALIKRIREAREQLTKCSEEFQAKVNSANKQKVAAEKPNSIAVWNPSFQREDFMEEGQSRNISPAAVTLVGTSQRKDASGKDDLIKESLDLKLSL